MREESPPLSPSSFSDGRRQGLPRIAAGRRHDDDAPSVSKNHTFLCNVWVTRKKSFSVVKLCGLSYLQKTRIEEERVRTV